MKKRWICTKCCRRFKLEGISIRTRFGSEECPFCDDPGAGMEFVNPPIESCHHTGSCSDRANQTLLSSEWCRYHR